MRAQFEEQQPVSTPAMSMEELNRRYEENAKLAYEMVSQAIAEGKFEFVDIEEDDY